MIHVGNNDALNLTNEILGKILKLKKKIAQIKKDCKVITSTLTYRVDYREAVNIVSELRNMIRNLNVSIVNNKKW